MTPGFPSHPDMKLPRDEIHLWFAFPEEIRDEALLTEYLEFLTPEEKARQKRFYFERHRHQYLITRAMVRTILSRYAHPAPQEWRFGTNPYGRPEIELPREFPFPNFNLSHTEGIIACALVWGDDIGVDIENTKRREINPAVADRFFSPDEVRCLNDLPPSRKKRRFFEFWTLKEAYIKARGMGLSIPLDRFSFQVKDHRPLHIAFDPSVEDVPADWQFWLLQPTRRHIAAIALRQAQRVYMKLIVKKTVPLGVTQPFDCNVLKEPAG